MVSALVVHDEDARYTLRALLEDTGYAVIDAADGVQALDTLRASISPLVVVLDLDLPRFDGMGILWEVADDECLSARHALS